MTVSQEGEGGRRGRGVRRFAKGPRKLNRYNAEITFFSERREKVGIR